MSTLMDRCADPDLPARPMNDPIFGQVVPFHFNSPLGERVLGVVNLAGEIVRAYLEADDSSELLDGWRAGIGRLS